MISSRFVLAAYSIAFLAVASSGSLGQISSANPTAAQPWIQGAPFPDASEEVLGATAGGKLYVFCGLAPGWKPKALPWSTLYRARLGA